MKKTYIAITSPGIIGTQSYWARGFSPCSSVLLADIYFVVYGTMFWQTVQTALTGASLYYWFVDNFGNSNHLEIIHTSFLFFINLPIMGSVASLTAQLFFVHCISVLGEKRSRWLCVIICLVSLYTKVPEWVRTTLWFFLKVSIVGALGKLAMGVFVSPLHLTSHYHIECLNRSSHFLWHFRLQ